MLKLKIEFNILLTYPEDLITKCIFDKASNDKAELNCVINNELIVQSLVFEKQIIRDWVNKFLTLGSITSKEEMNCPERDIFIVDDNISSSIIGKGTSDIKSIKISGIVSNDKSNSISIETTDIISDETALIIDAQTTINDKI